MHLIDLPTEILGDIIKLLDTKSKLRLWETGCEQVRGAARRGDVMRRVSLARCSLHFSELETWLADSVADYIVELDLRGRRDVDLQRAIAAVRRLPNLRSLDIAHTAVSMFEACDVLAVCPRLVRLAVRFDWPTVEAHLLPLGDAHCRALLERCRRAFRPLEAVHFVGDHQGTIECVHPFEMLQNCPNLRELRLTSYNFDESGAFSGVTHHMDCEAPCGPLLMTFSLHIHDMHYSEENLLTKPLMQWFNLEKWQMLVIKDLNTNPRALMTKKLYDEAINLASGDMYSLLDLQAPLAITGPADIHMWHVELEDLNPGLYKKISLEICERFPHSICRTTLQKVHRQADVYAVSACVFEPAPTFEMAKRRLLDYSTFNLDSFVQGERPLKILLKNGKVCSCRYRTPVLALYLDPKSVMLKNISFLAVSGFLLDIKFFTCLFQVCSRLETLVLQNETTDHRSLTKTVHLAKSIKCVQIFGYNININNLLDSMALCPTLENIYISDWFMLDFVPTFVTYFNLFTACRNLCDLSLWFNLPAEKRKSILHTIKGFLKQVHKPQYVNIKVMEQFYNHDPISDVFAVINDVRSFNVNNKLKLH